MKCMEPPMIATSGTPWTVITRSTCSFLIVSKRELWHQQPAPMYPAVTKSPLVWYTHDNSKYKVCMQTKHAQIANWIDSQLHYKAFRLEYLDVFGLYTNHFRYLILYTLHQLQMKVHIWMIISKFSGRNLQLYLPMISYQSSFNLQWRPVVQTWLWIVNKQ